MLGHQTKYLTEYFGAVTINLDPVRFGISTKVMI